MTGGLGESCRAAVVSSEMMGWGCCERAGAGQKNFLSEITCARGLRITTVQAPQVWHFGEESLVQHQIDGV